MSLLLFAILLIITKSALTVIVEIHAKVDVPINNFSIVDFISKNGYPIEVHVNIETEDGYLLDMHRIPYGKFMGNNSYNDTKPVVLLMHGLLGSAENWVVAGPERGLAFQLADQGYDVWMGNARGCRHSRKHTTLNPDYDSSYWQFSWHEIGMYDLPAKIDYIILETNQSQIFFIGHSQGTTAFYVMASERPQYNNNTKLMISLAPVAYMKNLPHPGIKFLSKFTKSLDLLSSLTGFNEFVPNNHLLNLAGQAICLEKAIMREMCANIFFLICGYDSEQLDRSLIPRILSTTPAGASSKQFVHYGQSIASGGFRHYDFGLLGNVGRYGSTIPPSYDISKITAPTALFCGNNDWLSSTVDNARLYSELSNPVMNYLVPHNSFNHLDFLFASNVNEMLYSKVFSLMDQFV